MNNKKKLVKFDVPDKIYKELIILADHLDMPVERVLEQILTKFAKEEEEKEKKAKKT